MDALDQHIKRQPWGKHYVRYVDDMVLIASDVTVLWPAAQQIDQFLRSRLGCALHPRKTQIMPVEGGLQFLGFVIRPWARYIKRETERHAVKTFTDLHRSGADPKQVQASANSFFGILRQAKSWRARQRLATVLRAQGHLVSPKLTRMFAPTTP
jgi:hypothetical protein